MGTTAQRSHTSRTICSQHFFHSLQFIDKKQRTREEMNLPPTLTWVGGWTLISWFPLALWGLQGRSSSVTPPLHLPLFSGPCHNGTLNILKTHETCIATFPWKLNLKICHPGPAFLMAIVSYHWAPAITFDSGHTLALFVLTALHSPWLPSFIFLLGTKKHLNLKSCPTPFSLICSEKPKPNK